MLNQKEQPTKSKNNIKHSKKRNPVIVYEVLVREIAKCVLDHNEKRGSHALRVLKKWFKPGTEVFKEFCLINSLVQARGLSEQSANHFLDTVRKAAATQFDFKELDHQKSLIIRDINHGFGEKIWENKIENYRDIATMQTLINHWRNPLVENISQMLSYEEQITKLITSPTVVKEAGNQEPTTIGEKKQLLKILEKKINEKWGSILSPRQKILVREWSVSNTEYVVKELQEIKQEFETKAMKFVVFEENDELKKKMQEAVKSMEAEKFDQLNEEQISRFLVYLKLLDELV
jgi:hypothetical protein